MLSICLSPATEQASLSRDQKKATFVADMFHSFVPVRL